MKIKDIVMEVQSAESAVNTVVTASRDLSNTLRTAVSDLNRAIEDEEPGKLLPIASKVSKWFQFHYQSQRKGGGYNLESALNTLKYVEAYKDAASGAVDNIKFNMQKDKRKLKGSLAAESSTKRLERLSYAFAYILRKKGSDKIAKELIHNMGNYAENLRALAAMGKDSKKSSKDDEFIDNAKVKADKDKKLQGQQRSQAEVVVNSILSSLPKDQAHEIKQAISRADNKLQALQQEMKKRGLIESLKYFKKLLTEHNLHV